MAWESIRRSSLAGLRPAICAQLGRDKTHRSTRRWHLRGREKDVRWFILEYSTEINLRKVDQLWFLDLITSSFKRPQISARVRSVCCRCRLRNGALPTR